MTRKNKAHIWQTIFLKLNSGPEKPKCYEIIGSEYNFRIYTESKKSYAQRLGIPDFENLRCDFWMNIQRNGTRLSPKDISRFPPTGYKKAVELTPMVEIPLEENQMGEIFSIPLKDKDKYLTQVSNS